MFAIFEQVLIMFLFAVSGFILAKLNIVSSEQGQVLSKLLVYLFAPCNIIKTFASSFTTDYLSTHYSLLIISVVMLVIVCLIAEITARLLTKDHYMRAMFRYSLAIPNVGYMGWTVIGALYGSEMMLSSMIFTAPLQIYIYTYGLASLTKKKMTLRTLINPTVISIILGIVLGLTGIRFPNVIATTLERSSACMGPTSMILAGIVVSQFKVKDLLGDVKCWIITLVRLLVIPIVLGLGASKLVGAEALTIAIVLYSMPCGLNGVVFPKLVGEDCRPGASLALISNVLACATVPLCVALLL